MQIIRLCLNLTRASGRRVRTLPIYGGNMKANRTNYLGAIFSIAIFISYILLVVEISTSSNLNIDIQKSLLSKLLGWPVVFLVFFSIFVLLFSKSIYERIHHISKINWENKEIEFQDLPEEVEKYVESKIQDINENEITRDNEPNSEIENVIDIY
jgi:formate hydrogenlyase subunit 3/multisubunit Na+/H+ antiporter MnhD subunit